MKPTVENIENYVEVEIRERIKQEKATHAAEARAKNGGVKKQSMRGLALALDKYWPTGMVARNKSLELIAVRENYAYRSVGPALSFMEREGYVVPAEKKGRGRWKRTDKPIE